MQNNSNGLNKRIDNTSDIPVSAGMPPSTILDRHLTEVSANNSEIAVVKDSNLKMYHVMSVKQSLREYQLSCRAADWSRSAISSVPTQFEQLELHVVELWGNKMFLTTSNSQLKLLLKM